MNMFFLDSRVWWFDIFPTTEKWIESCGSRCVPPWPEYTHYYRADCKLCIFIISLWKYIMIHKVYIFFTPIPKKQHFIVYLHTKTHTDTPFAYCMSIRCCIPNSYFTKQTIRWSWWNSWHRVTSLQQVVCVGLSLTISCFFCCWWSTSCAAWDEYPTSKKGSSTTPTCARVRGLLGLSKFQPPRLVQEFVQISSIRTLPSNVHQLENLVRTCRRFGNFFGFPTLKCLGVTWDLLGVT